MGSASVNVYLWLKKEANKEAEEQGMNAGPQVESLQTESPQAENA